MLILLLIFFVIPNFVMYGLGTLAVVTVLGSWSFGQRLSRFRRIGIGLALTMLVYSAFCAPYILDYLTFARHAKTESGFRHYETIPLPDRIAIVSSSIDCNTLCEELLLARHVAAVDASLHPTGTNGAAGKIWRYRLVSDPEICAGQHHYPGANSQHPLSAPIITRLQHLPYAPAYSLCLSAERLSQSDAPVTVREIEYDFRDQEIDHIGHDFNGKVFTFQRTEIWASANPSHHRLLASAEAVDVQVPYIPPVFTFPFQSHGFGIDGFGGKAAMMLSFEAPPPWKVFGDTFGLPLTGQAQPPPPQETIPRLLQNLSSGPKLRPQAAAALADVLMRRQASSPPLAPEWREPILAAVREADASDASETPDPYTRIALFPVLTAYGPATPSATPFILNALHNKNVDLQAAAITAASALSLFSAADIPWLQKMTRHDWWKISKAAVLALETLKTQPERDENAPDPEPR